MVTQAVATPAAPAITETPVAVTTPVEAAPATPVAPAATTPAVAPTTEGSPTTPAALPVATPAPVSPELQGYIAGLEQQAQQAEQQAEAAILQDFTVNRAAYYESKGLTPEQALDFARTDRALGERAYRAEQFRQGQVNAAIAIAERYKVDPRRLMNLPSEQAMVQAAEGLTSRAKESQRIAALEAEIARLKKAPVTTYANGAASGDGTRVTSDNIHGLWMGGKVSDATYRNFRKTGQIS